MKAWRAIRASHALDEDIDDRLKASSVQPIDTVQALLRELQVLPDSRRIVNREKNLVGPMRHEGGAGKLTQGTITGCTQGDERPKKVGTSLADHNEAIGATLRIHMDGQLRAAGIVPERIIASQRVCRVGR